MAGNSLCYIFICSGKRERDRESKREKEFFYLDVGNSILTHKSMYEIS